MSQPFFLPSGYVIRPARASDRWQLHRLLRNFRRESLAQTSSFSSPQRAGLLVLLGLAIALFIHTTAIVGLEWLLYIGAIAAFMAGVIGLSLLLSNDWQCFWVVEAEGQLIACAKLCRYSHYSLLFNVLVAPNHRQQGLGSALVQAMIKQAIKPLYLACFPDRIGFYQRFGFETISARELPPILRYDLGLSIRFDIVPLVLQPTELPR